MQNIIEPRHVLELQAKLGGQVNWSEFKPTDIQPIIESPRLSGVHFEEFIRQGGRMSLEGIPIKVLKSWTITPGPTLTWETWVRFAKEDVGNSTILSGSYDGMVLSDTLLKPKNFTMKPKVQVHMLEVTRKEGVLTKRMLELFELLNMYPSTVPEVFTVLNSFAPELPKGAVLLNACKNEIYQNVKNMLIEAQEGEQRRRYRFSVIGGDVEDLGCWHDHMYYFATSYD